MMIVSFRVKNLLFASSCCLLMVKVSGATQRSLSNFFTSDDLKAVPTQSHGRNYDYTEEELNYYHNWLTRYLDKYHSHLEKDNSKGAQGYAGVIYHYIPNKFYSSPNSGDEHVDMAMETPVSTQARALTGTTEYTNLYKTGTESKTVPMKYVVTAGYTQHPKNYQVDEQPVYLTTEEREQIQTTTMDPNKQKREQHIDHFKKEEYQDNHVQQYNYGYRVRDAKKGTEFGQAETRNGHMTKGNYHVLLPDGRLQKVEYWSDDSGFHADVSYDEASFSSTYHFRAF